jgi:hypothetical protein
MTIKMSFIWLGFKYSLREFNILMSNNYINVFGDIIIKKIGITYNLTNMLKNSIPLSK